MNKKTTTETKNISFKIDAKLHKRVKKYCEKNNITINKNGLLIGKDCDCYF